MSLDELELILCDMYEMDEWLPNPVFDKKSRQGEQLIMGDWGISKLCSRSYLSPDQNVHKKSGSNGSFIHGENGRLCFYESKEQFYIYYR